MRRENAIQRSIVDYLLTVIHPRPFVFAIPNAAIRFRNGRAGNAVPGLRPGMPDLAFFWRGHPYLLEVKTPKGRLSAAQIECHRELSDNFISYATVTSIEDTRRVLSLWRVETREAAA
jgi:hypothetical protein